jgi:hypothetical protein
MAPGPVNGRDWTPFILCGVITMVIVLTVLFGMMGGCLPFQDCTADAHVAYVN